MGIKGLWEFLKPVGQPVNLEALRGKVLAVDISFWLHHAKYVCGIKGISEHRAAVELVYRRILKLLHFGIRPIFVFDGPEASILKLPTLHERKKQREHQADEKAKRSQNRTLSNLARKALAVQLARDQGKKGRIEEPSIRKEDEGISGGDEEAGQKDDDDYATAFEALAQETVLLSSDDYECQGWDEFTALLPSMLGQCSSGGDEQQKSISVLFSGAEHTHVLIRPKAETSANGGGYCDGTDRRKEAVEKIRRLAALERLKNFRHNQQERCDFLAANRLLVFDDEKHLESSSDDDEFEEVPEAIVLPSTHKAPKSSSRKHNDRKRTSVSPMPVVDVEKSKDADHEKPESGKKYIVEKWGERPTGNGTSEKQSSGGETVERCRELVTYFGVPFVDSPAEAEAQCVHLELCGFTDGTITDDSDAWALGGRTVYRHVFDRKKSAMEYRSENVLETFGLEQLHFVALASILGCDFTPGVLNVGIVAALEIISTFVADCNGNRGLDEKDVVEKLAEFRRWWEQQHVEEGKAEAPEKNETKRRLRKLNCIFPPSFPDRRVLEIFTHPKVKEFQSDSKKSPFVWSQPDMDNLRRILLQELPDVRQVEMELADLRRRLVAPDPSQSKITIFYQSVKTRPTSSEVMEASCSKRLKKACEKLKKSSKT